MNKKLISVKLQDISKDTTISSRYDVYCSLENEVDSPSGSKVKYKKVKLDNNTFFDLGYIDIDSSTEVKIQVWIEIYIRGWIVSESKYTESMSYTTYDGGNKNQPIRINITEKKNGYGTMNRIVQPGWPSTPPKPPKPPKSTKSTKSPKRKNK